MGAAERLPTLLTEAQAAEYLGVSEITLARWRKAGRIGWTMIGRTPRYTEQHLLDYLDRQTCPASPSPTSSPSSSAKAPTGGISNGGKAGKSSGALQALRTLSKPGSEPEN